MLAQRGEAATQTERGGVRMAVRKDHQPQRVPNGEALSIRSHAPHYQRSALRLTEQRSGKWRGPRRFGQTLIDRAGCASWVL